MPTILAISPDAPRALVGRSLLGENVRLHIVPGMDEWSRSSEPDIPDLLVLSGLEVDAQQALVAELHANRRWRLVPVLYAVNSRAPGLAIPGSFRPEIDGIVRGELDSQPVQRRMLELAREGVGAADLVVAGAFELDPVRGLLRLADAEVELTDREAEILAILMAQPNRTVAASEIIERGWGAQPDARYLQILRRHVSNIRQKLTRTPASRAIKTVRGSGYRFDVKLLSRAS